MGMGFQHTILQRAQNYEIMCTEKMKNFNKKTMNQPMQVTDFSISRILSEENKNNVKNTPRNEHIYAKNKNYSSEQSDILDLSKHAASIYHNGTTSQQLAATAPSTAYNAYTGLGPMEFLMAKKFYTQCLPHILPPNYNLTRINGNQHYGLPSAAVLPITATGPMHLGGHVFQTPKTQRVFAPCTRVNCPECQEEYYQRISLHYKISSISSTTKSFVGADNSAIKDEKDTKLKNSSSGLVENVSASQTLKLNSVVNKSMTTSSPEEISYKCFICDKVFGCSQTLQAHEKTHKSPRYECTDCGKGFSQLRNYKYHLSVHRGTKEFAAECPECGKTFNDKGYLSSHMKIHRNKKEYECPYCPKSFNQRVAFNMHVRIHTGVKPHKCTECGKRFSRKMLLKQHMRTHSGEKPYQCSVCGKSFADRSNMTLHHRLHSGIKPFSCPLCPKAFTKKHHLKTHLNYHTGCKPYVCPHANCNQAFTQSSNMRTHAKKCQYRPLQFPTHPVVVNATSTSSSSACSATTTIIKNINCNNINNNNNYMQSPTVTNATALHFGMSATSAFITKPTTTTTTITAMPTSATSILYPVAALPTSTSALALPFSALHPHFESKNHCFTK